MTPFTGTWTSAEAAHLLRRCTFGATYNDIQTAVQNGLNATLLQLFSPSVVDQPLAYDPAEQIVAQGQTWVSAVYPSNTAANQQTEGARMKSLGAWLAKNLNQENLSLTEKMLFFWQNHFGVSTSGDARAMYQYIDILRQHALGNVKQLVKEITIDPCMLLFLNGSTNTVFSPNENYARELLELFTVGKGAQLAAGDYTTFTEQDVAAGAKIFTGYVVQGVRSDTQAQVTSQFMPILHDTTTKTLSYHFAGQTINAGGATEYATYIDVVFNQADTPTYICRKLYRYFVNCDITPWVEQNIIADMAQTFVANNFEIAPVLNSLFASAHFYDVSVRGAIIRSPLETLCAMLNTSSTTANFDLQSTYQIYLAMYGLADQMGQGYAAPPSVAGWTAYYQAPAFYRLWINSTYIKKRFDVANLLTSNNYNVNGNIFKIQVLSLLNGLSSPASAPQVVEDLCLVLFPKDIPAADKLAIKAILTGGLPDFEWTLQYNEYLADPTNPTFYTPVELRMQAVLNIMFKMPQFHVC
ncbi:MAG: hypothetical protein RIR94_81 [Bacteroidota bacterium]|jgi:uncharacterized protein (DUF1800 family)